MLLFSACLVIDCLARLGCWSEELLQESKMQLVLREQRCLASPHRPQIQGLNTPYWNKTSFDVG
jgi:hypothetical protein